MATASTPTGSLEATRRDDCVEAFSLERLRNLTMDQITDRYETFKLMSQFEVPE